MLRSPALVNYVIPRLNQAGFTYLQTLFVGWHLPPKAALSWLGFAKFAAKALKWAIKSPSAASQVPGRVGTKVTGITKRQFKPNLQRLQVTLNGTNRTVLVCTQCIRSGKVTKKVVRKPFRLDHKATAKA